MKFLDYDIVNGTHRSAEEEWCPHEPIGKDFFEWNYITLPMSGANGHQYFVFVCPLNFNGEEYSKVITQGHPEMIPEGKKMYCFMTHMCDYTDEIFRSDIVPCLMDEDDIFDLETNTLKVDGEGVSLRFTYKGDRVYVYSKTPSYEFELECTGGSQVMWMKDHLGIEGFIQEGALNDRSFYYSLPKLPFHGWLKYTDEKGKEVMTDVYGQGWIDRQWGDFLSKTWEWTSLRFADGERVNAYNFASGHQVLVYQKNDGSCEYYDSFNVVQNGYVRTPDNVWCSWDWNYTIPVKDKEYHLVPLSRGNCLVTPGNSFFEGMCRIIDKDGDQVGWGIVESMDSMLMDNVPYGARNEMPE